ncbi:hypothetical protein LY76DRAFT_127121 [Colletotrichum caudatum]|nr:hypothetical protein LY76DRAFT_127121 [Colletotrichum caudatum]
MCRLWLHCLGMTGPSVSMTSILYREPFWRSTDRRRSNQNRNKPRNSWSVQSQKHAQALATLLVALPTCGLTHSITMAFGRPRQVPTLCYADLHTEISLGTELIGGQRSGNDASVVFGGRRAHMDSLPALRAKKH